MRFSAKEAVLQLLLGMTTDWMTNGYLSQSTAPPCPPFSTSPLQSLRGLWKPACNSSNFQGCSEILCVIVHEWFQLSLLANWLAAVFWLVVSVTVIKHMLCSTFKTHIWYLDSISLGRILKDHSESILIHPVRRFLFRGWNFRFPCLTWNKLYSLKWSPINGGSLHMVLEDPNRLWWPSSVNFTHFWSTASLHKFTKVNMAVQTGSQTTSDDG